MDRVIFACRHNAGRSQMAAAFFNQAADPSRARAVSAGTTPAARVHPEVAEVMREVGMWNPHRRWDVPAAYTAACASIDRNAH